MDRIIVYPAEIPTDTDVLNGHKNAYVAMGRMQDAVLGHATQVAGFAVTPGSGLSVTVAPGSVFAQGQVDPTGYGSLAADTTPMGRHYTLLQPVTLSGLTVGMMNYIYATFGTADVDNALLDFYNADNPQQTFSGQGNTGAMLPTRRADGVTVAAGVSIPAGAVPLWQIAIPAGETAITAAMIARHAAAPFFTPVPGLAPIDSPQFIGTPTAPTPAPADSSTQIPTTSFVMNAYKAVPLSYSQAQATGNFDVPAGVTRIKARIRAGGAGGGAGGGNNASTVSAGGGGGGGAYVEVILAVHGGNNVSWVIGQGGVGGISGGAAATAGGDTVLYVSGVEVARAGGGMDGSNAPNASFGNGGAGGVGTVTTAIGYVQYTGAGGSNGIYMGNTVAMGGIGGGSYGFQPLFSVGPNVAGINGGAGSGVGGSGGTGTSAGGSGGSGEIIIEY